MLSSVRGLSGFKKNILDSYYEKKLFNHLKSNWENYFPFYIIAYDEQSYLSKNVHLAAIYGMMGETAAKIN